MALADDGGDDPETDTAAILADLGAPRDRRCERLAAADLPPPEPLRRTLERLASLDDDAVLLQTNDRRPQYLYPKLEDRGYEYATEETVEGVLTAIWRP